MSESVTPTRQTLTQPYHPSHLEIQLQGEASERERALEQASTALRSALHRKSRVRRIIFEVEPPEVVYCSNVECCRPPEWELSSADFQDDNLSYACSDHVGRLLANAPEYRVRRLQPGPETVQLASPGDVPMSGGE